VKSQTVLKTFKMKSLIFLRVAKRNFSAISKRPPGFYRSVFIKESQPQKLHGLFISLLNSKSESFSLTHPDAASVIKHLNSNKVKLPFHLLVPLITNVNIELQSATVTALFESIGVTKVDQHDDTTLQQFVIALSPHIKKEINHFELTHISSFRNLDSTFPHVRRLLTLLTPRFHVLLQQSPPNADQIFSALSGLQKCRSEHSAVVHLITLLTKCVELFAASGGKLLGKSLSRALYGFGNLKSKHREVRALVAATVSVISPSDSFNSVSVGNSLYGLRNLSSEEPEVRRLVAALTPLIAGCKDRIGVSREFFTSQLVANSLFGIRLMHSSHREVKELVGVLASLVNSCEYSVTPQELSNSLYGLQNMSSDHFEVCLLVDALTKLISQLDGVLSGQGIGNALFGMRKLSSDSIEVRRLLSSLTPLIMSCKDKLKQQEVGNALYGLQNMSVQFVEVRDLVTALIPKISNSERLSSQAVANSLYGLRSFTNEPVVNKLLTVLAPKISECSQPFKSLEIGSALFGLHNMSKSDNEPVLKVLESLLPHIIACTDPFNVQSINNSLFGLENIDTKQVQVQNILAALVPHASAVAAAPDNHDTPRELFLGVKQRFAHGLKSLSRMNSCVAVENLMKVLLKRKYSYNTF
jgi:hypothetical protein